MLVAVGSGPEVSVVMATRDRPDRLARALAALQAQSLEPERFEVIVVDDASGWPTQRLLQERAGGAPALRVIRRDKPNGPAGARNAGWRAARASLVAFTDDDCEAAPNWLDRLLAAARDAPGSVVQGPVRPNPADGDAQMPFAHTLVVDRVGPWYETANILYPRDLLEHLGGFDEAAFSRPGGEDTDLAWRAIAVGARAVWAPRALVFHAVDQVGWHRRLRRAWGWEETMLCFKRHPGLRRELYGGVFWMREHMLLALALGALTPRLPRPARAALLVPYARRLYGGRRTHVMAPFRLSLDVVEMAACVRGSIRYRTLVL